jgi:hypothetical protein
VAETVHFDANMSFISPVDAPEELPTGPEVQPGTMCFVDLENTVYIYDGTEWKRGLDD